MKKLTHIIICLLLAVLLTVTGCSFNPSSDFPQETEGTQTETPSDTSEEKPDNTPSEDNPSTTPEEDDQPSGGDEEKPPISDTLRDPTDIEKRIIYKLYFENISEKTIAFELGVSESTLNYRKKKILNKMKKFLVNQ